MARLKLLGALLRLDALRPHGFTAENLTEAAGIKAETARDALKRDKGLGFTEELPGAGAMGGPGRPAKLHRLRPGARAELSRRLVQVRGEIGAVGPLLPPASPEASDAFALTDLLETALNQLDRRDEPPELWRERLMDVRDDLAAARREARALREQDRPEAIEFERRLEPLEERLAAAERLGVPETLLAEAPPDLDLVRILVETFGRWAVRRAPRALQPMVLLLDGIRGDDPVSTSVVERYAGSAWSVATFDVARMPEARRHSFYASLDRLREATPLAVADLVLTVDGSKADAERLAAEFRDLSLPGAWRRRARVADPLRGLDSRSVRRSYMAWSDRLHDTSPDSESGALARHVSACLTALDAAERADAEPLSPFDDPELHRRRLLDAAHHLMGAARCFDSAGERGLRPNFFGNAPVVYEPQPVAVPGAA